MLIPFWTFIPALGFLNVEVETASCQEGAAELQPIRLLTSPQLLHLSEISVWGTGKLRVLKAHLICGRTSAQTVSAGDHQCHLKALKSQEHKSFSLLSL